MKKKEIILTGIIICILIGGIFIKLNKQENYDVVGAFKENTENITVEAAPSEYNIEVIKDILADSKILGLGDSTLGCSEFDKIKLDIIETAVKEEGYRVLALYVDFGVGQYINDYVQGKENITIDKVKEKVNWVLRNKGLLDMIEWVKQYNESCDEADRVSIYGMNIWDIVGVSENQLRYLEVVDRENIDKYNLMLKKIKYGNVVMLSNEEKNEVLDNLTELRGIFEENKEKYISLSSEKQYNMALEEITVIEDCINALLQRNELERFNVFERHMATLIGWIYDYEGENKKILINATNSDVSVLKNQVFSMGNSLKEQFGDDYYSLAFDFYKGSLLTYETSSSGNVNRALTKIEIQQPIQDSIGEKMHKDDIKTGFMDFRGVKDDIGIGKVLSKYTYFNNFCSGYTGKAEGNIVSFIPLQSFDGLIFVDEITAAESFR